MKKVIWIMMCLMLVLSLVMGGLGACKETPAPAPAPTAAPAPPPPAAPVAKAITLKYVHQFALAHDLGKLQQEWADTFNKRANGKVVINVFPAEQLVKAAEQFDAVKSGIADIAQVSFSYHTGAEPLLDITNVPFLYGSHKGTALASVEMGDKVLGEVFAKHNSKILWWTQSGFIQAFTTKKKQIKTLEDWKGLMMRAFGGLSNKTVEALGSSVVSMPAPDVYMALQTGTIDGMVTSLAGAWGTKQYEVVRYLTLFNMSNPIQSINVNLDSWKKLPPDMQKLLVDTANEFGPKVAELMAKQEAGYPDKFKEKGLDVYVVPPEERAKWIKVAAPAFDTFVKSAGPKAQELIDITKKYMDVK